MSDDWKVSVTVRLPIETADCLKKAAKGKADSLNEYIATILTEYVRLILK